MLGAKRSLFRVKGRKDRYAMHSPALLERLHMWWRVARTQGKLPDGGWSFPGLDPVDQRRVLLNHLVHLADGGMGYLKRL